MPFIGKAYAELQGCRGCGGCGGLPPSPVQVLQEGFRARHCIACCAMTLRLAMAPCPVPPHHDDDFVAEIYMTLEAAVLRAAALPGANSQGADPRTANSQGADPRTANSQGADPRTANSQGRGPSTRRPLQMVSGGEYAVSGVAPCQIRALLAYSPTGRFPAGAVASKQLIKAAGDDNSEAKKKGRPRADTLSELCPGTSAASLPAERLSTKSAQLKEQAATLQSDLSKLVKAQAEMDQLRSSEAATFAESKAELEKGIAGLKAALKVLNEYYSAESEAYAAADGAASGFISLLEVAAADFPKNLAVITSEEEAAVSGPAARSSLVTWPEKRLKSWREFGRESSETEVNLPVHPVRGPGARGGCASNSVHTRPPWSAVLGARLARLANRLAVQAAPWGRRAARAWTSLSPRRRVGLAPGSWLGWVAVRRPVEPPPGVGVDPFPACLTCLHALAFGSSER